MSGDDYTVPQNIVRFPGCDDQYCTDIGITDDNVLEPRESFTVSLWRSEGTGNEIRLESDEMEVVITDNDGVFMYFYIKDYSCIVTSK